MLNKNLRKDFGGLSGGLLIFGGIVVVAAIIVIIVVSVTGRSPKPSSNGGITPTPTPLPVYETVLGNIKFKMEETRDRGSTLLGSKSRYPEWKEDLTTKEKFIEVKISAQNTGKVNIMEQTWDIGKITDNEGREYEASYEASDWVPADSMCGALLKPAFTPTMCTKIYEVSAVSTGLKIKVIYREGNQDKEALLDLGL